MTNQEKNLMPLSPRLAALTAGFGLLAMLICAPFEEFFVFSEIFVSGDAAATLANIQNDSQLLTYGMIAKFITYTADIVVVWALYFLFKHSSPASALLMAWTRIVYTGIAFIALAQVFSALDLVWSTNGMKALGETGLASQVYVNLSFSRYISHMGLALFGVHLIVLGGCVIKSNLVPSFMSLFLFIAGGGYLITTLFTYLIPDVELGFLFFTYFGEIIFMLWLLIMGWFLKPSVQS